MKVRVCVILLLAACGVAAFFFKERRIEYYRDQQVSGGELRTLFNEIAVHASPKQYLIVNGTMYKGIRGQKPYYLNVPKSELIVFVTESAGYKVTFHILNLVTGKEDAIDGGSSGFGWSIGSGAKPGDLGSDYVEEAKSNFVTLVKRSFTWKEITTLNLVTKRVEQVEVINYGSKGNVINRVK